MRKRTSFHEDESAPRRSLSQAALKAAAQIRAEEKERAEERAKRRQGGHAPIPKPAFRSNSEKIVAPVFFEARTRRKARVHGVAFVSCAILSHVISVASFRLFSQQSKAIEIMDVDKFFVVFPRWLILHSSGMICQAITQYSIWELRMMVQWRTAFQLINALYSSNTFYHLSVGTEKLTRAPEQVMCEEAFLFVEATVNLAQSCLREIPDLFIKMYLLFEYRTFFLVYAVLSLPLMGAVMQRTGKITTPLTMNMLKTHADINFVLARTENNAEQIALFRGGSSELRQWEEMLNRYRGCMLRHELIIPMTGVVSAGFITLVMLPLAWSLYNDILEGGIAVAEAFNYFNMVGDIQKKVGVLGLTMSMLAFQEVRAWFMCQMLDASDGFQERDETRRQLARDGQESSDFVLIHEQEQAPGPQRPVLELRDVMVTTPASISKPARTLLEGVNLRLHEGQSLLIVGETGVGKSALLLSIQGLWFSGRGHVHRCGNKFMFCVPQRPYMFRASLRDNMMYPEIWRRDLIPDSKLREVLEAVNLTSALRHYDLDEVQPWNTILSLGQQQRLAIARGLLMKDVRLLLLDEATSALDMQNERRVYSLLQQRVPAYASVGHRPSLREYHTHMATLEFNEELDGPEAQHRIEPMTEDLLRSVGGAATARHHPEGLGVGGALAPQGQGERYQEPSMQLGGRMNELGPDVAPADSQDERFRGPSMLRHMGGLPLVRRAVQEVILPLAKERHFWVPVSLVLFLLAFNTSVLGVWTAQLMAPVTAFQDILRLRNRDLAWAALKGLVWQAPVLAVLGYFTVIGGVMLHTVLFVETKRGLARLYLDGKHDTYYHLHMSRLVTNPGTRISNWDTQTAIRWIAELVSTTIMSMGLIGVMSKLAAQAFGKLFIAYLLLGWAVLFLLFHTLFGNYNGWLTDVMHLHSNIIHTRENAEAVALLDGSESERMRAYEQVDGGITPGSKYVFQKSFFGYVSSLWYTELLDLCLMCIYNPMVLVGTVALGESETSKNLFRWASSNAFAISRDCIGKVEGQLGMERLWELMVSMTAIRQSSLHDLQQTWGGGIKLSDGLSGDVVLEFKQLALKTPLQVKSPSRTLVKEVSVAVRLGETVLIAGESGIGKSSLVRAIAGLWRNGSGEICRPHRRRSFFIAQRPYMCVGTLREQLLYPRIERRDVEDEYLERVLRLVELDHLLVHPGLGELRELSLDDAPPEEHDEDQAPSAAAAGNGGGRPEAPREEASLWVQGRAGQLTLRKVLSRVQRELPDRSTLADMGRGLRSFASCAPDRQLDMNWVNSLSLGEIQRISFARLLLQEKLHLVTLDEATSGLSPEGEETMYNLIKTHTQSYISVAHRPQLRRFHQRVLLLEALDPEGKGEPEAATCRDLPMAAYQVELADQDRRTWGRQPDE